jgi:nucleoid-associated protein YgaU
VTVAAGDSLWSITARQLGTADVAAIDSGWRELYALNRDVIGDDPGLILPRQVLDLPASLSEGGEVR